MTEWLLDKSAHVRWVTGTPLPADIDPADLAICEMGMLEWLYSARSADDYDAQALSLRRSLTILQAPGDVFGRVQTLQSDLAHRHGMWHRTALPDLFIAETALHHNAGVLHLDGDYDRIGDVRPRLRVRSIDGPHRG